MSDQAKGSPASDKGPPAITAGWAARRYDNIGSFLNTGAPGAVEDWLQPRLRDGAIARLVELTKHRHPFRRVVDLGCGIGDWSLRYLAFADEVVGVDVNGAFLDVARRAASTHPRGDRVTFLQANMREFKEHQGAELVCLGACTQYLDDGALDEVLGAIAAAQKPGDFIYLRSTCAHDYRQPVANDAGFYRRKAAYQGRLERLGYRILDRRYSSTLLLAHLAGHVGLRSFLAARLATSPLNAIARLVRLLTDRNDFVNWVAVRA